MNTVNMMDLQEFNKLVIKTYGRPYSFQQQDGCKDRGIERFTIPTHPEDYENDTVPEIVNHGEMGVSFKAWLQRDPNLQLSCEDGELSYAIRMWWVRNFYPHVSMILNDLHSKGLLPAGELVINIDW